MSPSSFLRHRPRTACLIAALLALGGREARAEDWVDLLPSSATESLQLDRSTVTAAAAGTDRYAAVWRVGSAPGGRRVAEQQGVVDCRGESLQILVATDLLPDGSAGAVVDYRAGSRHWQGHTTALNDTERAAAHDYPAPGSRSARLVEAVCADRVPGWADRQAAARRLPIEPGCGAPASAGSPPCAGDASSLATAGALGLRLRQAREACRLDSAAAQRLQAVGVEPAGAACAGASTDCVPKPLQVLAGLDDDLARAAAGLPCRHVPELLAQAAEDDALGAARARFQACVGRALPRLDDRVSDADVIAKGVFGACRGELPATIAQGPLLANGLLPGLTATVLEQRRAGRVTLPTKPRRSEAE